jgi:hypothetical protein
VHDALVAGAAGEQSGGAGPTVAPRRRAVGEQNVGRTAAPGAEAFGLGRGSPTRRVVTRVVVVRAGEKIATRAKSNAGVSS